jgi:leader peptidase (prepilin peptidase)/N-methyltransferase
LLAAGPAAVAIVSFASLAWPVALASMLLGTLMIAGAEVDARTFLLPDTVTLGALAAGIAAAAALDPIDPGWSALAAALRASGTAAALLAVRAGYARLRHREGLGLGDIKLAAAIGAWLPLPAIPICFALAANAALMLVLLARQRGRAMAATAKLPFGAFLCPALWLMFYATALPW